MANCTANGIGFPVVKRPVLKVNFGGGEVSSSGAAMDATDVAPIVARYRGHDSEIPQEQGEAMIPARQFLAVTPERRARRLSRQFGFGCVRCPVKDFQKQ